METETQITKSILQELRRLDIFAWKHWQGPMSKRGVSDILACLPDGRFLAIEIKRPGLKLTVEQRAFLADINRNGGLGIMVTSVNELMARLSAIGIRPRQRRLFG